MTQKSTKKIIEVTQPPEKPKPRNMATVKAHALRERTFFASLAHRLKTHRRLFPTNRRSEVLSVPSLVLLESQFE